jgi:hypothetical protein
VWKNEIVGYMIRDFQIILEDRESESGQVSDDPNVGEDGRIYTPDGQTTSVEIIAFDDFDNDFTISVFSELVNSDAFQVEIDSTNSGNPAKIVTLTFHNTPEMVRDLPYPVIVRFQFDQFSVTDLSYLFYTKDIQPEIPPIVGTEKIVTVHEYAYPNPFKDCIHLNIENKPGVIEIRNMQGRVIEQQILNGSEVIVDHLTPGPYLFTIRQKNKVSVVKAIKK